MHFVNAQMETCENYVRRKMIGMSFDKKANFRFDDNPLKGRSVVYLQCKTCSKTNLPKLQPFFELQITHRDFQAQAKYGKVNLERLLQNACLPDSREKVRCANCTFERLVKALKEKKQFEKAESLEKNKKMLIEDTDHIQNLVSIDPEIAPSFQWVEREMNAESKIVKAPVYFLEGFA